jgi:predicted component of type VI protein secretion system
MFCLSHVLVALEEGPDIPTGRAPIIVGRHPHCDVRLRSPRVSRRHCCLTEVDGAVVVRDLGSTNGTLINGRRVGSGRLRPGDVLSIANLRYRMEQGQAGRASTADAQPGVRGDSAWPADPPGTSLFDQS